MATKDKHREVINRRISDVLAKNVLSKYEAVSSIIKKLEQDPNINFTVLLTNTVFKRI